MSNPRNTNNTTKLRFFDYLKSVAIIIPFLGLFLTLFIYFENRFNIVGNYFNEHPTLYALGFGFICPIIVIYVGYYFLNKSFDLHKIRVFFKENRSLILGILLGFLIYYILNSIFNLEDNSEQKNGIELREDTKEDDNHWTGLSGIQDSLDSNSKGIFIYNDIVEVKEEAKGYKQGHDIEGSFGTSDEERKDEVADTKRKGQLPIQEDLADIRLFPLPADGYIFLGTVREKDGKKIWISRFWGNPFDIGDVFTEDYPKMKIFIEANRCSIYDEKIINNGHIVAFDTEYRVNQNIQLESRVEGGYNAWLFVELKK